MIPRFICWLFGHKRIVRNIKLVKREDDWIKHIIYVELKNCFRCDKKL